MASPTKKFALIILGVTALACSRVLFVFFNDPEGPNLLIVTVLAAIVYLISLVGYFYIPPAITGFTRLMLTIAIQIVLVAGLYVCVS